MLYSILTNGGLYTMKKFFIIFIIILVLAAILLFVVKKDGNDSAYNFIFHFDEAEKINFENGTELDAFLPSRTLSFAREVIQRQVFLLFSNNVKVLLTNGIAREEFGNETGRGGFRFIFPAKGMTGIYNFYFKKTDESNYWLVEFAFHGESSGIKIIRCKAGISEEINRFDYQIKSNRKLVFMLVFFSDFLVLMDESNILFQIRDPSLKGIGKIGLDCKKGNIENADHAVKFAQMPESIEDYLLKWHNANFPAKQYHRFNYKEREWNRISYRQNLVINGKMDDYLKRLKIGNSVRPSILFRMNASLIYTMKVPENGILEFYLSVAPLYIHQLGRLNFTVQIEQIRGNKTRTLIYNFGRLKKNPGAFIPCSLDLKEFGGSKCRVTFKFSTPDGKLLADERKILLSLSSPAIYPQRGDDDYNVILISLDTLRASSLGCYGYQRETSKNIDKFAREGIIFKNAIACSDWTLPSHMSMFTSMYPFECGLIKNEKSTMKKIGLAFNGTFIADETQTIAGYLQEAGYKTIAVHGGGYVSEFYGFDKGFSLYDRMNGKAEDAVELAIKYLENNKKHKLFLFFHTYEIHEPYKHDYFLAQLPSTERTYKNNTIARYDSGIRYADIQISKLINWLKKNSLFDKTLIIITSDHGENFDRLRTKEGAGSHGNTLYDSEIHVPLIFGGAVPFNQKLAIADQVSSVDILPTLMNFLNIPVNGKVRGISLIPLIEGKKMAQRMAYSEGIYIMKEKKSVRTLENKLIANLKEKNKNNSAEINYELYDLVRDKKESENIFALKPTMAKTFVQYLKQIMKSIDVNRGQLSKTRLQFLQHDKELMNDLKGLGYIGN